VADVKPTPVAPAAAPAPVTGVKPTPAPQDSADSHHAQARKLLLDGNFSQAIEQFTAAIRLDPAHALAYNGRGFARFRLKQYKEAVADFDEAIRLNPGYANAYQNRGVARRALGDKAGAGADLAKSKELSR
jgi:tetratricopeptide (TPR) repeat protein